MNIDLTPWRNKRICVAVSGGGDSMALLHYFHTRARQYNITLSAVNCEHGIRGASSISDSAFVADYCVQHDIELFSFSADCPAIAKTQKISLETAARNFRYNCFNKLLSAQKADFIAIAHHLDDNAETVLFRLCRGSSLTGVSGIHSREQDGIIRPMLHVTRSQIEEYLLVNHISYCHDETNDDEQITRNAIRMKVLPEIEKVVPAAAEGIVRFAELAGEDDEYLYQQANELIVMTDDVYGVKFSVYKPLFRRACLQVMKRVGIEKDYTAKHLNDLYALQSGENGDKLSLPCEVVAIKEYDRVTFYKPQKACKVEIPFPLFDESTWTVKLGENLVIVGACPSLTEKNLRFSRKKIPSDAVLRTRREGDVFTKFGGGTKKLKDYLIDKKIPLRARDELILLASGGEVLAIVGVEISNKIKMDDGDEATYIYMRPYKSPEVEGDK